MSKGWSSSGWAQWLRAVRSSVTVWPDRRSESAAREGRAPPAVHHLELEVRVRQRHEHVAALAELGRGHEDPVVVRVGRGHAGVDERGQALGQDLEGDGDLRPVAGSHAAPRSCPTATSASGSPSLRPTPVRRPMPGQRRTFCYRARISAMADTSAVEPLTPSCRTGTSPPSSRRSSRRELAVAHEGVVADLARLVALYDRHDVRAGEPRDGGPTEADVAAFDEVLAETNDLLDQVRLVSAYLYTFISTDSSNDTRRRPALAVAVRADRPHPPDEALRGAGWPASARPTLVAASEAAAEHALPARSGPPARRQPPDDRGRGGSGRRPAPDAAAWPGPGSTATSPRGSRRQVADGPDGELETLPMSIVRGLAHDPDPDPPPGRLRRRAGRLGHRHRAAGRRPQRGQGRGRACSTAVGAGPTPSTRPCSPTASTAPRSRPCRRR